MELWNIETGNAIIQIKALAPIRCNAGNNAMFGTIYIGPNLIKQKKGKDSKNTAQIPYTEIRRGKDCLVVLTVPFGSQEIGNF